ncbi:MAG TPA: hypothetical protein VIW24_30380 [Aldersonia sp.]
MLSGLLGSAATAVVTTALLAAIGHGSWVAWFMNGASTVSILALPLTETVRKDIGKPADDDPSLVDGQAR